MLDNHQTLSTDGLSGFFLDLAHHQDAALSRGLLIGSDHHLRVCPACLAQLQWDWALTGLLYLGSPSSPGRQGQSAPASGAWIRDSRGNSSDAAARHVEEGAGTGPCVQG